ncbi:MAG: hypothetical protein IIT46_13725 [Lachnospiraceae bacterium]|nr:hypothetical protein [Lachnospiraceae bacterium]
MDEKKKNKKWAALWAISSSILFLIVCICGIPFMYQVCDDKYLMQFASGQYTGEPSDYMIHIRFPISYVYSFLYKVIVGVDWYGTIMIGMQLICVSLLMYKVLKKIDSNKVKAIVVALVYGLMFSMWVTEIVSITYTTSAAFLGLTAIVWYAISDHKIKDYIFCILLMVITYNIRYETFYMVVPFAGVIWLYDFIMSKKKMQPILFAVGVGVGLLAVIGFDNHMYGSEEWKHLFAYNGKRILLYDYYHDDLLDYEKYKSVYNELGMDETDRDIIESYDVTLVPELQDQIQELVNAHKEERSIGERLKTDVKTIFSGVLMGNKLVTLLTALVWMFTLILLIKYKDWIRVRLACGFIGLQIVLWLYLGFRGRVMTRVSRSMMFMFSIMALLCIYYFWQDKKEEIQWNHIPKYVYVVCGIILIGTSSVSYAKQRNINIDSYSRTNYYDVESYCNAHSDNFYFVDLYSISDYEGGYHYNFFNKNEYVNFAMLGDWMGYSPLFWQKLNDKGITNIQDSIFKKDGNVYVIASTDKDMSFIEKLRDNVTCNVIDTINSSQGIVYNVYQFQAE